MSGLLIHSARLVDSDGITEDGWILFRDGKVAARGRGTRWQRQDFSISHADDATIIAGKRALLVPGFIDLHCHGGGGHSHEDGPDHIVKARAFHLDHGTTSAVISLVTNDIDALTQSLRHVRNLAANHADIHGSHLEGPFLAPSRHGAHTPAMLRTPDETTINLLLDAAGDSLRIVTLAPELPGALDAIRRISDHGAIVAIGHTEASDVTADAAFGAGATLLTHAFNAMPGLHHRNPGPVGAALTQPGIYLEVIADGAHLDDRLLQILFKAAADRIVLITDAISAAGMPDGNYELGPLPVTVSEGIARVTGKPTIAGSTLTQDAALRRTVNAGIPLEQAIAALTINPASVLRRPDLGNLQEGSAGDAVLLHDDLTVAQIYLQGERVRR